MMHKYINESLSIVDGNKLLYMHCTNDNRYYIIGMNTIIRNSIIYIGNSAAFDGLTIKMVGHILSENYLDFELCECDFSECETLTVRGYVDFGKATVLPKKFNVTGNIYGACQIITK